MLKMLVHTTLEAVLSRKSDN